jgi:periplasmic divalent cation tolerance protein
MSGFEPGARFYMTDYKIVLTTTDSLEAAQRVAHSLVEQRLAACVNIIPGIQSIYRWKDKVEQAAEWLLVVKTQKSSLRELEEVIKKLHSYDVPEFIAVSIDSGSSPYLLWLADSLK